MATKPLKSITFPGLSDTYVVNGLTPDIKDALLQIAEKVAYIDEDGQDYYDALEAALYPSGLSSITAVYTQSGTVYPDTSLDDLKSDLVVTAYYQDSSSETVNNYTLSGTLAVGTSTVTVSYGGKTTTFSVAVSEPATLVGISAVYTQSGTVYNTDSLNSLKSDLVVTATYSDSNTETVPSADYTLSGTLTAGTSTITVTYEGETDTFSVTVTADPWNMVKWVYTDGMPTDYGFTEGGSTGSHVSSTMTSDGLYITARETYVKYYYVTGGAALIADSGIGVVEAVFTIPEDSNTNAKNYAILKVSNGTNGVFVQFRQEGNNGDKNIRLRNGSTMGNGTDIGDWNFDTEYTVKLVLNGQTGQVYVNGTLIRDNIDVTAMKACTSNDFGAQNAGNFDPGYGAYWKSFKARYGSVN